MQSDTAVLWFTADTMMRAAATEKAAAMAIPFKVAYALNSLVFS